MDHINYPYADPDADARARGDDFFVECSGCGDMKSVEFDDITTVEDKFGNESHFCEDCTDLI